MKVTNLYKNCAGPNGIQLDISFAGCEHKCKGCYVPELWDPTMHADWSPEYIHNEISKLEKHVDGFTLLGGDPLFGPNIQDTLNLIKHLQQYKKPITMITGYTIGEIRDSPKRFEAYERADIIVTGRYQENFRQNENIGSGNQIVFKHRRTEK